MRFTPFDLAYRDSLGDKRANPFRLPASVYERPAEVPSPAPAANDLACGQNQDPGVTPLQGRVAFHQERLFRSTGSGTRAHQHYITHCRAHRLPEKLADMTRAQCIVALALIERSCLQAGLGGFRDCRTQWETA